MNEGRRKFKIMSPKFPANNHWDELRDVYLSREKILVTSNKRNHQQKIPSQINSNGIISKYSFILTFFLISFSITSMITCNNTFRLHSRTLINYFTITILQQNDLSIYDNGDNVDQPSVEYLIYEDVQNHFKRIVGFIGNYSLTGFAEFHTDLSEHNGSNIQVQMKVYSNNGSFQKSLLKFGEFQDIFKNLNFRDFLLSLRVLSFQIWFGDSRFVKNFKLIINHEIFSHSMLTASMSMKFDQQSIFDSSVQPSTLLRVLSQICAVFLLIIYVIEAKKLFTNHKLERNLRTNSLYWCFSLILLNFVAATSEVMCSMCAILQLLPIFEKHDSSSTLTYNFNVNLRYATPLIVNAIIPVFLIMNAFIFYSMLMYPGDYFDDYLTSFFSYFYNNFQYGIYEIFTELKSKGNLAYILYVILYFYMVLVGGNLVPALFCILIYRKMAERQILHFINHQIQQVACPTCLSENQKDQYALELNIESPKSPYIKSGTKIKSPRLEGKKVKKMFIVEKGKMGSRAQITSAYHSRIREFEKKVSQYLNEVQRSFNLEWLEDRLAMMMEIKMNI